MSSNDKQINNWLFASHTCYELHTLGVQSFVSVQIREIFGITFSRMKHIKIYIA